MDFNQVSDLIKQTLTDAHIEITDLTGTRDHLNLLIVSDHFAGKKLLQQHQMIMDILREDLKEKIHAVQLKTMTFEKAKERGISIP
jgi:stress-induced morphogen